MAAHRAAGPARHDVPVWAMLATPFTADGTSVDRASLRRYCDEVIDRGCRAVVVLGVIGEPGALGHHERLTVVETALATGAEVHVATMAATRAERLAEVTTLAERFGDRITGYLVPITTSSPQELRDEAEDLYAAGGRAIVLQDYPASSGVRIAVDDLARAVAGASHVAAIKCEAPPTFGRIRRLRELVPEVGLMSGLGGLSLVDDLGQGARLVASGTSRPEVAVQAVRAWLDGDEGTARRLVGAAAAAIGFEIQQGTSIAIRKEHWRRQGVIASAAVRPPAMPYEPYLGPLSDAYGFAGVGE
ncbi:dihydrodipicolinate synthase family protein [Prauserella cavernicola]|uniref:Dihydrodipicolinate synthase family protein n=1 Tax=Prauserella cavernicola TaxID=2800127 RepID=A0A934V3E9_9PSEU|nr:dihydrodipicolinate synthase family protein [Prauserella cavernicola]MBK1787211.1 dihydrodipicolinate synthase family protein [Prauserella cavernicola]